MASERTGFLIGSAVLVEIGQPSSCLLREISRQPQPVHNRLQNRHYPNLTLQHLVLRTAATEGRRARSERRENPGVGVPDLRSAVLRRKIWDAACEFEARVFGPEGVAA